tara:strand:- start:1538 stop:1738 length:201 start_codon:yes stop_codon:yes gene_type:complete
MKNCKHNNVWHIDECEGDSDYDIFECKDCNKYFIVEKLYHDWDNASVIPENDYHWYDLKPLKTKSK